jgi:hypothetical protein
MSNENKQTAVEWFADKIRNYKTPLNISGVYFVLIHQEMINRFEQQAKEMEKEQIIKACDAGFDTANLFIEDMKYNSAEDYYEKTYGGNK